MPLLLHGEQWLFDSTDILKHADALRGGDRLYPRDAAQRAAVEALEDGFDDVLGPHTRRWAYAHLLSERRLLRAMMARGVPRFEALLLPLLMPLIVPAVRAAFRITPDSAERSRLRVWEVFRDVGERLGDGRQFLVRECFSAADLTFAALASPMLLPPQCGASYPAVEAVPATMRDEVLRLRETAAGRFALRLYGQHRVGAAVFGGAC